VILQRLFELSERLNLVGNPDFKLEKVDFVLNIDEKGTLVQAVSLRNEKGKGSPVLVPKLPKRSSGVSAGFLYDNIKYVLGAGSGKPKRDQKTLEAFRARVRGAAETTSDAGLEAVERFLVGLTAESVEALREELSVEEWSGDERFCFAYVADKGTYVHDRKTVREWLVQQRGGDEVDCAKTTCLVTGKLATASRLHDNIKGVAGAKSSGAALVSFNSESFTSHGLEQGANASVSKEASDGYVAALNWMLGKEGKRPHRYGIRTGETTTVFWTKEDDEGPGTLASIFDSHDPDEVRGILNSPWFGTKRSAGDSNAFYVLTLGGNAARVVVREWMESSVTETQQRVHKYFDDVAIHDDEPLPLRVSLNSLKPPGRSPTLPPDLEGKMIRAALFGASIPSVAFHLALRRIAVPGFEGRLVEKARFSLIRAYLLRNPSIKNKGDITVALDTNNARTDYNLGRLFAVIEYLQGQALGDRNASIRDKYFAAASSRPASVIPRLLSVSVHHESKLSKSKPGFAVNLGRLKGEIMSHFPASGFPSNLDLEGQGRFAIGYYHQRQDFFKKRDDDASQKND
jgi:CRISPR-associated protein Csd1